MPKPKAKAGTCTVLVAGVEARELRRRLEQRKTAAAEPRALTRALALAGLLGHDPTPRRVLALHAQHYDAYDTIDLLHRTLAPAAGEGLFTSAVDPGLGRGHERAQMQQARREGRAVVALGRSSLEHVGLDGFDTLALFDPAMSASRLADILALAGAGAGSRLSVLVTVPIEDLAMVETELEGDAWQPVWWLLRVARDYDPGLGAALDAGLAALARQAAGTASNVPAPWGQLGERLRLIVGARPAAARRAQAFWHRAARQVGRPFVFGFELLRVFAAREGHAEVPFVHAEAGFGLGGWVLKQRQRYRARRLEPGLARQLETLPGWSWQPNVDRFARGLEQLRGFVARHGHLRVPRDHPRQGFSLSSWVQECRTSYRRGTLAPEKVAALEALPGWTWQPPRTGGARPARARAATPRRIAFSPPATVGDYAGLEAHVAGLPAEARRWVSWVFVRAFLLLGEVFDVAEVWAPDDPALPEPLRGRLHWLKDGFDAACRTTRGELWLVHADFRYASDAKTALTRSLFPAETAAAHRLLITNRDELAERAQPVLQKRRAGLVTRERLLALGSDFFRRWRQLEQTRQRPAARHRVGALEQRLAADVAAVLGAAAGPPAAQLVAAPGASLVKTALLAAEQLGSRRGLVFSPTFGDVYRSLETWCALRGSGADIACVYLPAITFGLRAHEVPTPVLCELHQIHDFWHRPLAPGARRFLFAPHATATLVTSALRGGPKADLLIVDETHRLTQRSNGPYPELRGEAGLRAARRLYLSAVPLPDGAADPYGRPIETLTFDRAVAEGMIVDYRLHLLLISREEVARAITSGGLELGGAAWLADDVLACAVALRRPVGQRTFRRALALHHGRPGAEVFADKLSRVLAGTGDCFVGAVWAGQTAAERREVLARALRTPSAIVAVGGPLPEEVGSEAFDAVIWGDRQPALPAVVEALSHTARPLGGRGRAQILLPIVVDPLAAQRGELTWYRHLRSGWALVNALCHIDPRLPEAIDAALGQLARRGGHRQLAVPEKGSFLAEHVRLELYGELETQEVAQHFWVRFLRELGDSFERGFGYLERFFARARDARVTKDHHEAGFPLGHWVGEQRKARRAGKLGPEQIARLEALAGWSWAPHAEATERGFELLERFVAREGHARVPQGHREDGFGLGAWTSRQRNLYQEGRLPAERIATLEAQPGWYWDWIDTTFSAGLEHLLAFVAREGHARVSAPHVENGYALGRWCAKRRSAHRQGRLDPELAARLDAVPGWSWEPLEDQLEHVLGLLRAFSAREGHARVPAKHTEQGFALGSWVAQARNGFRYGRMPAERATLLEAIPGWTWEPRQVPSTRR